VKSAVVTGASGFVGTHAVQKIASMGVKVYALCGLGNRNNDRISGVDNVSVIECDLLSSDMVWMSELPEHIDVIYHLAWTSTTGPFRTNMSSQMRNVVIADNVSLLALAKSCKKIVVTGTVSEHLCTQIETENQFHPIAFYLHTKRYIRNMFEQFSLQNAVTLVYCTFCHPIGYYNKTNQIFAKLAIDIMQGEVCTFGPANYFFDVIAVEDLAHALYLCGVSSLKRQVYYVGSGNPQILKQYIKQARDILNPDGELQFDGAVGATQPLQREWLDCSEFCAETGFVPKVDFEEAFNRTVNWVTEAMQSET